MVYSGIVLLMVVLCDALQLMDLLTVACLGVASLLLMRTLTVSEALEATRPRILLMIASSFALGSALQVCMRECVAGAGHPFRAVGRAGGGVGSMRSGLLVAPPCSHLISAAAVCLLSRRWSLYPTRYQNTGVAGWVAKSLVNLTVNSGTFTLLLSVSITTSLINALVSNNACMVLMFPVCVTVRVCARSRTCLLQRASLGLPHNSPLPCRRSHHCRPCVCMGALRAFAGPQLGPPRAFEAVCVCDDDGRLHRLLDANRLPGAARRHSPSPPPCPFRWLQ